MEMKNTVVFYPCPFHLAPVVELAKLMTKHHPSISIAVVVPWLPHDSLSLKSFTANVSSAVPSLTFIHLPPLSDLALAPPAAPSDIVALFFEIPQLNNPSLHQALLTLSKTSNIKAFVMDFFCNAAFQVSSNLNIPTYYFRTAGAFAVSMFLYFPTVDDNTTESLKDVDILVDVPGSPPIPSKDMPIIFCDKSHRVHRYLVDAGIQMAKSKGIIVNTFEALEKRSNKAILDGKCTPGETKVPRLFPVGPLVVGGGGGEEEHECLTWLDSQPSKSVVFLCFGRYGVFSSRQLKEIAIALERSGVRFLWVVRNISLRDGEINATLVPGVPALELGSLFPEGFLDRTKERGLVVSMWAPQAAVLNHGSIGGFVTHCGWSSILEAVSAGVPMLAWPLYAEQRMNRLYLVKEVEMALAIREDEEAFVSADELEERVTELMSSEKGEAVRKRAMEMKQRMEMATSDGGSSRLALAKLVESFEGH